MDESYLEIHLNIFYAKTVNTNDTVCCGCGVTLTIDYALWFVLLIANPRELNFQLWLFSAIPKEILTNFIVAFRFVNAPESSTTSRLAFAVIFGGTNFHVLVSKPTPIMMKLLSNRWHHTFWFISDVSLMLLADVEWMARISLICSSK